VNDDRSVPLGKYWRSRPLLFSFDPRCQGEAGSGEEDGDPGDRREFVVAAHLAALIPGQRPSRASQKAREGVDEGVTDMFGASPVGQVQEHHVAGGAVDEGADG